MHHVDSPSCLLAASMGGLIGTSMSEKFGTGLRALVVDDEPTIRFFMQELLSDEGFDVETAEGVATGLELWANGSYDLVITDKNLQDGSGLEIAERIIEETDATEVVIMSAFASLESAVEAIRMRVADYLVKPFDDINMVLGRLRRVIEYQTLKKENRRLIVELQDKTDRLEGLVVRDSLTGLFNHAYFQERLENEIKRSQRYDHECGLVFIDVDRFKEINDEYGHQVGDVVLKRLAEILHGKSRASDDAFRLREHDIAARYGGDEFVLVLPETPKSGAATKAERLRKFIESTQFEGVPKPITLSIGVACYPEDGTDRQSIVAAADTALYGAKRLGRNRVMGFTAKLTPPGLETPVEAHTPEQQLLALESSLEEEAIDYRYQPIVDARNWRIYGYEALCKPSHDAFQNVLELIDVAERAGRIDELGRVMRAHAIKPIAELEKSFLLFINLHRHELVDPALLDSESAMRPWASRVVLEIGELGRIAESERSLTIIGNLRDLGFKIALAGMASGYSSLSALETLQVDYVKIHRGLSQKVDKDPRTARLVKHIVEYCEGEGILAVAEGIETVAQCELIRKLGCPLMQGFLFGQAEPPFAQIAVPPGLKASRRKPAKKKTKAKKKAKKK